MKTKNILLMLFLALSHSIYSQAQLYNEIGVFVGATQMQTDYGQKDELNLGTVSYGVGLLFYTSIDDQDVSFRPIRNYLKNHLKLRTELSFSEFKHDHLSKYAFKNTLDSKKIAAMHGSTKLVNLGAQLEFYWTNLEGFEYDKEPFHFNPFIGFGGGINYYDTKAYSDLGEVGLIATTFEKFTYPNEGRPYSVSSESKFTSSIATNIGTRVNISRGHHLMMDVRFQYFFSDWVDGLNPNRELFPENVTNDTFISFNVGYIYFFD